MSETSEIIEIETNTTVIEIVDEDTILEVTEDVTILETAGVGIQGAKGDKGDKGDTGDPGEPGPTLAYVHVQNSVSDLWTITHNLGIYPQVTIVDSAGTNVEGAVGYINNNELTVSFGYGFTGTAYLS